MLFVKIVLLILGVIPAVKTVLPPSINIGALLHDAHLQRALDFSIWSQNEAAKFKYYSTMYRSISYPITDTKDSFKASKSLCQLLTNSPVAFIGPTDEPVSQLIHSMSKSYQIPFLAIGRLYENKKYHFKENAEVVQQKWISLTPPEHILGEAIFDILNTSKWTSISIIYDNEYSLVRLSHIISATLPLNKLNLRELKRNTNIGTLMKEVKSSKDTHIILDVDLEMIPLILEAAKQVDMVREYYRFIVTNWDAHILDFSDFYESGVNITYLSLFDPESKDIKKMFSNYKMFHLNLGIKDNLIPTTTSMLLMDTVTLISEAVQDLALHQKFHNFNANCTFVHRWRNGAALKEYILNTGMSGFTGAVRLDSNGHRTHFALNIIKVMKDGPQKMASWSVDKRLVYHPDYVRKVEQQRSQFIKGRVFRVVTVLNPPYTMLREGNFEGNDRFEGFCIDIIKVLSEKIGFNYEIYLAKDGAYGKRQPDGSFNGMIRDLMNHEADMAIVDLSITYERSEAVDFTQPFLSTGISILYKKEEIVEDLFLFVTPFSTTVWVYTLTAFVGISIAYYIIASISPYEHRSLLCEPDDEPDTISLKQEALEMTLPSRFWFVVGSIMQQGSDLNPVSISCRIIASIWWFFTLIVVSSYTANLAATLTSQQMDTPIKNAEDLATQSKISFGCLKGGSTQVFFQKSSHSVYSRMWDRMAEEIPTPLVASNTAGIRRVLAGNYAYLMEATTIEYQVQKDCRLTQIGGLLDRKGYGIATPFNSNLRDVLSVFITNMTGTGELTQMKEKWWGKGSCEEQKAPSQEMGMMKLAGVFIVLLFGCAVGFLIMCGEFLWELTKTPYRDRDYLIVEVWRALVFALCGPQQRPKPKSSLNGSQTSISTSM